MGVSTGFTTLYCPLYSVFYDAYMLCMYKDGIQQYANKYFNGNCFPYDPLTNSIAEVNNADKIEFYPNPANDYVYVQYATNASYKIINALGQILLRGKFTSDKIQSIDIHNLPPGIYQLIIQMDDRHIIKSFSKI